MWDSPKAMLTYHDRGFSRHFLWIGSGARHAGSGLKISLVKLENVENTALMGQRYHRFS